MGKPEKVAIIGAGMGGLFAAWRLQKSGRFDVTVYEGSDRTGGRLLTWFPETNDLSIRGELGGMRFIPQQHQMVARLVEDLSLEPVLFPATTLFSYLRGTRLAPGGSETLPYQLSKPEEGKSSEQLLNLVIDTIAEHNKEHITKDPRKLSRREWDDVKPHLQWGGHPLTHIGFWNVMLDIVSNEGYHYITDDMGYYSLTSNWNAAEALQFIATDFSGGDYFTLHEGYSALAGRLGQQLEDRIVFNMKLDSVAEREGGGWTLTFNDDHKVEADRVIMGVPGRALDMITFPSEVRKKINKLQPALLRVPAFKLFLYYDENWWGDAKGRFTTTLPLRQTYSFNVYPSKEHLMVMASYDDLTTVPYWHGLTIPGHPRLLAAESAPIFQPQRFSGLLAHSNAVAAPKGFVGAPEPMVVRAHRQLQEAVGRALPYPKESAYMDWSHDPYGGGWSFWAPGADVPTVMSEIRNLATDLYVVGDSFSGIQGWVEGALSNTEKLLQEQFRLDEYMSGHYLGH